MTDASPDLLSLARRALLLAEDAEFSARNATSNVAEDLARQAAKLLPALARGIEALTRELEDAREALWTIAEVGDGYGPRNQLSGTNGEGHQECRYEAERALGIKWEDIPPDAKEAREQSMRERHRSRQRSEPTTGSG